MEAARDRDLIARQYCTGLADVFELVAPGLTENAERYGSSIMAIVATHLRLLARLGDSLVLRKCGPDIHRQLQTRANHVLDQLEQHGWTTAEPALADFDFWLRSDGHRRNPGATADLIAAGLLVAILQGQWQWMVS
jgi:triphosphoribosyl-dephospho-CoA synthase